MELEDHHLFARLRKKYSEDSLAANQDTMIADSSQDQHSQGAWKASTNQAAAAALPDIRLCPVCQGSGMRMEVYEYRRLESTCNHCQGEGVFVTGAAAAKQQQQQLRPQLQQRISSDANNGCLDDSPSIIRQRQQQQQVDAANDAATAASCNLAPSIAAAEADASCRVEAALPRLSTLQRTVSRNQGQLKKMQEKIEELQQEYMELSAAAAASSSAEERQLQEDLMQHLQLHVEHLQEVYQEKLAACGGAIA